MAPGVIIQGDNQYRQEFQHYISGTPCEWGKHENNIISKVIIPRTGCHDDRDGIQDLTDLPGPATEDAIIRHLRDRFLSNHFQVWFLSHYYILIAYCQTTVIRMNPGLSSTETGLAKLVEEWVGSMEGQAQDQVVILSGKEVAWKTITAELI